MKRGALYLFCSLAVAVPLADQERNAPTMGHTIAGRVVDPFGLKPQDAILMVGHHSDNGSFSSQPVVFDKDGRFVTSRLRPGTYVLEILRTPHSATKAAVTVGFRIVDLAGADETGVTVSVRQDTSMTGRFRMDSDDPNPTWPPQIVVNAYLAREGEPLLHGAIAEGARGGTFVLRNVFGPRVLRSGYTLAPGASWWPSHVTLDGRDITNVPTDFSEHAHAQLEFVFTQRPARITGTVTDSRGQPVRAPWIVVSAAEPKARQRWATTSEVTQGDTHGRFSLPVPPGHYLVRGLPQSTFASWKAARDRILQFTPGGRTVTVLDRKVSTVHLQLQP